MGHHVHGADAQHGAVHDEYLEPNDTTLKEWLELWQDEYLEDVKQSTADRYKSCIRIHIIPALGETRLMDLRASTIQKFLNQCKKVDGLSEKSVKNIRLVLHKALEQAIEDEQIKKIPVIGPKYLPMMIHPRKCGH